MPQTFQCPKCGAPVSYEQDVIGANLTARCSYCHSSLPVPNATRSASVAPIVNIDLRNTVSPEKATKWIVLIILIPVIGIVIGVIVIGGFLVPLFRSTTSNIANTSTTPGTAPSGTRPSGGKDSSSRFAMVTLQFGEEGIGPGMFKDARSIAVDGAGRIYVGEYIGGRIQVFDQSGKFMTQWMVDPKMPLRGLAADRDGTVYVVQRGKISRHQGATGYSLGELEYADGNGFDDVVTTADGGLLAAWYRNRDDIVRFNSAGKAMPTIRAAISSTSGDSELNTRVAIDGLGNVYALGTFNNAVFKFGPDRRFVTRFGDAGDQPGQFRAASAITVDGKGRVYVSDIRGIQVFDGNGRYLTVFKPQGMAFGMVMNDKGELFVAARTHVLRYSINE
jgi:streptogramin lyase